MRLCPDHRCATRPALDRFLLAMRYDQPRWRQLMDLEGLKRWIRPDATILEGYRVLFEAVEKQKLAI